MKFEKNQSLRVLISGGSGLIGTQLTKKLTELGYEVAHLTRSAKTGRNIPQYQWDITTMTMDSKALEWADVVIHLAGAGIADHRWTQAYRKEILDSRVNSTQLLLNYMLQDSAMKPQKFIAAGAVGYYGHCPSDEVVTEQHRAGTSGFLAATGIAWEDAINQVSEQVPTVCLRTGPVLSADGGMVPKVYTPLRLGSAAYFGSGSQMLPWIHIDDLVNMYIYTLQQPVTGTYNATAPKPVSNIEFARAMKRVYSGFSVVHPVPAGLLKIMLGSMAEALLTGVNAVPARALEEGFEFRFNTVDDALEDVFDTLKK